MTQVWSSFLPSNASSPSSTYTTALKPSPSHTRPDSSNPERCADDVTRRFRRGSFPSSTAIRAQPGKSGGSGFTGTGWDCALSAVRWRCPNRGVLAADSYNQDSVAGDLEKVVFLPRQIR
jgi:hypothetical protein